MKCNKSEIHLKDFNLPQTDHPLFTNVREKKTYKEFLKPPQRKPLTLTRFPVCHDEIKDDNDGHSEQPRPPLNQEHDGCAHDAAQQTQPQVVVLTKTKHAP